MAKRVISFLSSWQTKIVDRGDADSLTGSSAPNVGLRGAAGRSPRKPCDPASFTEDVTPVTTTHAPEEAFNREGYDANPKTRASILMQNADADLRVGNVKVATSKLEKARALVVGSGLESEEDGLMMRQYGKVMGELGHTDKEVAAYREALRALDVVPKTAHTQMEILAELGIAEHRRGRPSAALLEFERAKNLRASMHTMANEEGAQLLEHLAFAKRASGLPLEARSEFETAVRIRREAGLLTGAAGAALVAHLGAARGALGNVRGELDAYREARRIREASDVLETIDGATLVMNTGVARRKLGDLELAMADYEEAQAIFKKVLGVKTLGYVALLANIGALKGEFGELQDALNCYQEAKTICKRNLGLHTDVGAGLLANLAVTEFRLNKPRAAQKHFEQAKRVRMRTNTLCTIEGAHLLRNMALLKRNEGKLNDSLNMLHEALEIFRDLDSLDTPGCEEVLTQLQEASSGAVPEYSDDNTKKIEYCKRALRILKRSNAYETTLGARLLATLAMTEKGCGKLNAAVSNFETARLIHMKNGSLYTEEGALLMKNFGLAKRDQGDLCATLVCLEEARTIHEHLGTLHSLEGLDVVKQLRDIKE